MGRRIVRGRLESQVRWKTRSGVYDLLSTPTVTHTLQPAALALEACQRLRITQCLPSRLPEGPEHFAQAGGGVHYQRHATRRTVSRHWGYNTRPLTRVIDHSLQQEGDISANTKYVRWPMLSLGTE